MLKKDRTAKISTLKNNLMISEKCIVAESFVTRLKGLMGRESVASDECIFFPRCNSVHMWFMKTPIDVVFVTRKNLHLEDKNIFTVTKIVKSIRPWTLVPAMDFKATDTLELSKGSIERFGISVGDKLCIG